MSIMMTKAVDASDALRVVGNKRLSAIYALGLFALFVLLHGVDMFHFCCVGDELRESMEDVPDIYIAQRRWGTAVWKLIFGYGYLPYLNVLVFSLISTAAVLFQLKLLEFKTLIAQIVYGLVYSACPVWFTLIGISHLADVFALSMLCSTMVVYALAQRDGIWSVLVACLFMLAAMSLYQTSVFYVATLWWAWYICRSVRVADVSFWRESVKLVAAVVGGWGACYIVSCVLRRSGFASLETMHLIEHYQGHFSGGIRGLLSQPLPDLLVQLGGMMRAAISYAWGIKCVNGSTFSYAHLYYAGGGLMVLVCAFGWLRTRSVWAGGCLIIFVLSLLLLPYATYVISCGTMTNLRMYMATGVAVACVWALGADNIARNGRAVRVLFMLLAVLMMKGLYAYTEAARDRVWYAERTKVQFFNIRDAAHAVAQQENLSDYKVIWVGDSWEGKITPVSRALEMVDDSLLTGWVQPFAVKHFAAYYGCGHMEWAWSMPEDMEAHVRTMPVWPHPGSVQRWGQNIVVKVYQSTRDE